MVRHNRQRGVSTNGSQHKWLNSPVTYHAGNIQNIQAFVPEFERRSFEITQSGAELSRLNEQLDIIVRRPFGDDPHFIPVGVVSKEYALVQHADVIDEAIKAFKEVDIELEQVKARMSLTAYGERMSLSLFLPDEYAFDPGDGHPMALRLECFNSVDGSTRFKALMGWFRFVCSNGLVIGVTRSKIRRRHIGDFGPSDVAAVLKEGLPESKTEMENFKEWRQTAVDWNDLVEWVERDLRKGWGFKAAARFYHISRTGRDAEIIGPYKDHSPMTIPVKPTNRVPGTPKLSETLFDVSQILAWLAKERRDLQEQQEWRESIPGLLAPLRK